MDGNDVGEILADWEALKSRDYARQKLFEQTIKVLEVTSAKNKILREQKSALETHQNSEQGQWGQERGGHRSRDERIASGIRVHNAARAKGLDSFHHLSC
ncbi:hypothetical protein LTR53_001461 [Teratosphaeriaceae sp. CCFEE 6253]|nr:hypothetical protein LTR53_001461 [Teratosphaeriaceae sp. CCFEE 6253]